MIHAPTYYSHLDNQSLLDFRREYDPTFKLIHDHIGIISRFLMKFHNQKYHTIYSKFF